MTVYNCVCRLAVAQRQASIPCISGSTPVIGGESIFYTPSPSPTFVARRPMAFTDSTPFQLNNNLVSKDEPEVSNRRVRLSQTPIAPTLCQPTLPYSPYVISAHTLAHAQNIYPFMPSLAAAHSAPGAHPIVAANQIALLQNSQFPQSSATEIPQAQCIFK